jgi:fermentation-respiration switch protein FrsA (DUF1100 family)
VILRFRDSLFFFVVFVDFRVFVVAFTSVKGAGYPRVIWTAIALLGLLAALAVMVRAFEPRFAFFPLAGETTTPRDFGVRYEELTIPTRDGERLHAWLLPADTPRARIIYFHGNGGNLSVWAPILTNLPSHGYSVLAFDYRGYGLSTGRPGEQGLYRDVDAVIDGPWRDADRRTPIVYWGRSLGTVMAAYAASIRPPDGMILEAGFPDLAALARSSPPLAFLALFSSYRFPTAEFLRQVHSPTLVMHGDADTVVPFALGRALFERLAGAKHFVTIHGGDHNDLAPPDEPAYWGAVDAFISSVRVGRPF